MRVDECTAARGDGSYELVRHDFGDLECFNAGATYRKRTAISDNKALCPAPLGQSAHEQFGLALTASIPAGKIDVADRFVHSWIDHNGALPPFKGIERQAGDNENRGQWRLQQAMPGEPPRYWFYRIFYPFVDNDGMKGRGAGSIHLMLRLDLL